MKPLLHNKKIHESFEKRRLRARKIIKRLEKHFPEAGMILNYSNNWELLVAVILSAQCTDKKVNQVTEKLFRRYKTLNDYLSADPKEFESLIYQTGFFHAKTRHILAAAKIVKEKFNGEIPKTMHDILTLPGVARKTANVVLGNAHKIVEGIAVDTHVRRVSNRLGLSQSQDPKKIERDLMALLPKKKWFESTYLFIEEGRNICKARDPRCDLCPIKDICPSAFQFPRFQKHKKAISP